MENQSNKEKFTDSMGIDLGGTRDGGKIYFDSSNKKEAKERMDNFFDIAEHKRKLLEKYKLKSSEDEKDAEDQK